MTRSFFPFANALSRSRRYFREGISRSIGFFKGAFFPRFEMPTAVVFLYSRRSHEVLVPRVARDDAITPRVTRLIALPPSGGAYAGHSVVHARAPRRASGRRRRYIGLPPGAVFGGAARAKHPPPARVPVG